MSCLESIIFDLELRCAPTRLSKPRVCLTAHGLHYQILWTPTVRWYRQMYHKVGAPWLWWEQKTVPDSQLQAELARPGFHVLVLGGIKAPQGYGALSIAGATVNIDYFGLVPGVTGRGIGRVFLQHVVHRAWRLARAQASNVRPPRVTVNTCDHDHPKALLCYQSVGFEIVSSRTKMVDIRRATKLAAEPVLSVA